MPTVDAILQETGWGLYNKFLIAITALCLFAEGWSHMSIPFVLPLAACHISITPLFMRLLNFYLSLGNGFGGLVLSAAADFYGRKLMLASTLLIIFMSCLALGFANEMVFTAVTVFFLGSGLSAHLLIAKINLVEGLPLARRAKSVVFCEIFWSLGCLAFSFVCWASISLSYDRKPRLTIFRILYCVSGTLCLLFSCTTSLLQESPFFLLSQHKIEAAIYTLRHMYCVNTSKHWHSCMIRRDHLVASMKETNLEQYYPQTTFFSQMLKLLRRIYKTNQQLVSRSYRKIVFILVFLKVTTMFSHFSVNVWLTHMIIQIHDENCSVDALQISHLQKYTEKCDINHNLLLYIIFWIISFCTIAGQLILLLMVDNFTKRLIAVSGCLFCGISSFIMIVVHNIYMRIIMSAVFMLAYSILDSILTIIALETFSTTIRGTAISSIFLTGTLIEGLLKLSLHLPCSVTYEFMGVLMFVSSPVAYLLFDFGLDD